MAEKDEAKELWPGAGLWLDAPNIKGDDFELVVEPRLRDVGDTPAQIAFLKRLRLEFNSAADMHKLTLCRAENVWDKTAEKENAVIGDFERRREAFGLRITFKLHRLEKILEIEREEQRNRRDTKAPADSEGIEDEPATKKDPTSSITSTELGEVKALTAAQRVWVFRFLLVEAGMLEDDLRKTEIARSIVAATNSDPSQIYERVRQPEQKTLKATYQDLTAVRSWFDKLKMVDIVKKVDQERKNFEG